MKKTLTLAILMLSIVFQTSAQRTITDQIAYTYVMSETETIREAEMAAIKQAQLQMIADHFGTLVSSSSTITMSNVNGQSDIRDFTFGETEVKGEWVRTIGTPFIQRQCIDNQFIIKVTIRGEIREVIANPVNFQFKVLRNGSSDRFESTTFKHGDYLCVSFQTPEEGYLAIYITDGETVQCLYPYPGLPASAMNVKADRKYVLFSKENPGDLDPSIVRRMPLGCNKPLEHNRIYIIFSPNKFTKAVDYGGGEMPGHLSFTEFHTWLSSVRRRDTEMSVSPVDITISK
ncbi:MAG: hypothetical protein SO437_04405 [Candidatus Cryptobacteroides sp.]|nr:hypothetical protein [Candidatus Cryptobacteroides sp.]